MIKSHSFDVDEKLSQDALKIYTFIRQCGASFSSIPFNGRWYYLITNQDFKINLRIPIPRIKKAIKELTKANLILVQQQEMSKNKFFCLNQKGV
ncbi:hypothetical protein [Campylobacter sp. RM16191]|uniref:hypothetical protein n=1 Tax=Campylobacter sp. RM16191 TaxID=1705728 RepID=UPI001473968B|nr:hypothetical protein [Campylobacter sp. RM16191]